MMALNRIELEVLSEVTVSDSAHEGRALENSRALVADPPAEKRAD
jgi:hypothetical protein